MDEQLPSVSQAVTDDGRVKRRRRPALSCVECRMRKVKCDRMKPCGACIKIKSERCTYRSARSGIRAASSKSSDVTPDDRSPNQSSSHEHGPIFDRCNGTRHEEAQSRSYFTAKTSSVDTGSCAEGRATSLVSVLLSENERVRTATTGYPIREDATRSISDIVTDVPGTFQKSKFFGQSHWMNAMEPVSTSQKAAAPLNSVLTFEKYKALGDANTTVNPATDRVEVNKSTELYKTVGELKTMARILKTSRMTSPTVTQEEAMGSLPSKTTCDVLVGCYFRTFEGVFRVLHGPSFYKEYGDYWSGRAHGKSSTLLKIMLVCAIGVPFYRGDDQPRLRVTCSGWIYAAESWLAAPHAKSRLNMAGLQIQILVILAKQVCNVEGDHVWILAGSLLRTAMYLGLHRDPTHFGKINFFHAEMRRRLWATVLELTAQSSLDMGMPPMISMQDYDTKPPSNINDADLHEQDDSALNIQPAKACTHCSIQIAFAESLPLRLEVIRLINSLRFDLSYLECLRLGRELTELCEMKTSALKDALMKGANITPFQIKLFDSLVRRFILALHRPYFSKAKDNPQYHYSRKICLDASLAIFAPATAPTPGVEDDWARMTYRAVGFFKALILYAMSTIYCELNSQIEENQKLSNLTAPLVSEASTNPVLSLPPQTQMLYDALAEGHLKALRRLQNGETNPKGLVFFACALARIDALVAGTDPEAKVLETAKKSISEIRCILADVYEQEHGEPIDLGSSRITDANHGRGDGADDVTGRRLPTGTGANDGSVVEGAMDAGTISDAWVDVGFDSHAFMSDMDFSPQFFQDPEWFFESNTWADMGAYGMGL